MGKSVCAVCGHDLNDDMNKLFMGEKSVREPVSLCTYRGDQEESPPGYKFKHRTLCWKCFVEWFDQNKDWLVALELMEGDG